MRKLLLLLSTVLFLNACSTHEKILKSDDVNYKLTKGNEYYDEGKWMRAKDVYERLLPVFRGTPNYEELYYRYAYTLYKVQEKMNVNLCMQNLYTWIRQELLWIRQVP